MNIQKKMDILCPHFVLCSGCRLNTDVDHLPLFKEASTFFAERGSPSLLLHTGAACGWRTHAKLAVRGAPENPLIGLFEEGSHRIVDIPLCRVHHPKINQAVEAVRQWIKDNRIVPYDETSGKGLLRYLQLAVERQTLKVQLTLVLNSREDALDLSFKTFLQAFWEKNSNQLHSLWLNFNARRDNLIFGGRWTLQHGQEWLWESFCGHRVCFHPASFAQANSEMFERLLEKLQQAIPLQAAVAEFYAGVGVIGLTLAERCRSVHCIEIVPLAQRCFEESVRQLPQNLQKKLSFSTCDATQALEFLNPPTEVVIVDPPRKGLDALLLQALCASQNVHTLVYISCGWESFKRDCQVLLQAGWQIKTAEAFLFFPGSEHLETLVVFEK